MKNIIGIYGILSPTNKIYIGKSLNITKRWTKYKNLLCKSQSNLYNSLKKYGVNSHAFFIVECSNDQNKLNELENYHWKSFKILDFKMLNCREPNGSGGSLSEETKLKIGLGNLHKKRSEETKNKMSKSLKGNGLGRNLSLITIEKIKISKKGKMTEEHKNKIRESRSNLNENVVVDIWRMIKDGYKQKLIANIFNVNQTTISDISRGKRWNNVTNINKI